MSDDLVKRLRDWGKVYPCDYNKPAGTLYFQAADRIEADAKRIAELKGRLFNCSTDLNTYMTAHEAAEARVKVLEDALHRVEGMTPSLANAATAHDLHLTVRSIARAALEGEK